MSFLDAYDRYKVLFVKSEEKDKKLVAMCDCLTERWRRVIKFKHPEVLESDEAFKEYLEEEKQLLQVTDIAEAFSHLQMDMKIQGIKARLAEYDMHFLDVKERCKNAQVKDRAFVKAYVSGIRPMPVRQALEGILAFQDVTLAQIVEIAEEKLLQDDETYKLRQAAKTTNPPPTKDNNNKPSSSGSRPSPSHAQPAVTERASTSSTSNPTAASVAHPKRENAGKCKICGGKWSMKHWIECKAAHPLSKDGKSSAAVNAVDVEVSVNALQISAKGSLEDNIPDATIPSTFPEGLQQPTLVPISVGSYKFEALLDCGAAASCVSIKLLEKLMKYVPIEFAREDALARMADSNKVASKVAIFCVTVPTGTVARRVTVQWPFVVLPDTEREQMLLGRDLGPTLGIVEDFKAIGAKLRSVDPEREIENDMKDDLDDRVMDIHQVNQAEHAGEEGYKAVKIHESSISGQLRELCREYQDIFQPELHPDGADFPPYKIKLLRDEVVCVPPRPIKPLLRAMVHEKINEMRVSRLVEDAHGPWSSAAVIIVKGDKIRVCGDYRELNNLTEAHVFPLPDIRLMLQFLAGKQIFGKFDLRQGFHQMVMDKASAVMTSLRTPDDYVYYVRVPFGVKNGPMVFQENMQILFSKLLYKYLGIFIDDIICYEDTDVGFLKLVRDVFGVCRERHLRLRAEKCELGAPSICAVGYELSAQGRKLSEERVASVKNIPQPRDVSELRSFLGAVNYFHEFIPHLSELEAPLNRLLQKGVDFVWTEEAESAMKALKSAITSEELMAYGTEPGVIVLRSDASGVGIGGVLLLRNADGKDRPITYFSKTLTTTQRHWSTIEQELYALVVGVTLGPYKDLLKMRPLICETDHRNLVWLEKVADSGNPKLQRWRMLLMQYDITIKHIPGATNQVADALSRLGHEAVEHAEVKADAETEVYALDLDETFVSRLREAQRTLPVEDDTWLKKHVFDQVDKLWYTADGLLIVPSDADSLKKEVLSAVHGSPFSGHLGMNRTCNSVRASGYYWSNLATDVEQYIKECPSCQKFRDLQDPAVEMRTIQVDKPFVALHIDSMGPFPIDEEGYQYITAMIDPFTHWVRLGAMKSLEAVPTAELVYSRVFLEHGLPLVLSSDNGTQFVNKVIDELLQILAVKHHTIIPYHPQSNGVIERTNQEILRHLRLLVIDLDARNKWSFYLPMIEYILNHTVQSSTNFTPYAMMYGRDEADVRDPLKPISLLVQQNRLPELLIEEEEEEVVDYVRTLTHRLAVIQNCARRAQEKVLNKRAKQIEPTTYELGSYVLLTRVHDDKPRKLAPRLLGPFKVIAHHPGQVLYKLQSLVDPSDVREVHTERMRSFLGEGLSLEAMRQLAANDKEEFLVDEVMTHKGTTKDDIEFLIHWRGYGHEEDSWEPFENCNGNDKLELYLKAHPDVKKIVRARAKQRAAT